MAADPNAFTIRRATPGDAPGVLACLRAAFEPFRQQYSAEGFADTTLTVATVHDRLASMAVFVAVTALGAAPGTLIGTIGCQVVDLKKDGHIRGMAVLPDWQGKGVADQLLSAVEQELRRLGCSHATLDTTAPLARAIRFYERRGYRATGRVADFYGMPLYEYAKPL